MNSPNSPIIYHYLKKYQEDPSSRVFAPLAEAYRKAGLVDQALEIAREGLRVHPHFVGGRVALARALFDKKAYAQVADELGAIVQDVPDNLVAQRLLAESCLMLGRVTEALSAYKMLLFFTPHDAETAQVVQELEAQSYEKGALVLNTDPRQESSHLDAFSNFAEHDAQGAIDSDPGLRRAKWVARVERLQTMLQRVERYKTKSKSK